MKNESLVTLDNYMILKFCILIIIFAEELMPNGSDDEIEIRGTSIYICEQIKNFIRKQIRDNQIQTISENDVNGILIDHFLWDYRRKNAEMLNYIPFHKVLCIYY